MITGDFIKCLSMPWMWAGILLLVAGGTGFGYVKGLNRGFDHAAEISDKVAAVGAEAQAKETARLKINASIAKETDHAYTTALASLRLIYANPVGLRLPSSYSGSGGMPSATAPSGGSDAATENPLPDPGQLASDCADTTLMLLYLQQFNASLQ